MLLSIIIRFEGIYATPHVRVGDTTIIGTELPTFKQEFFGGKKVFFSFVSGFIQLFSGIPYAQPPLGPLRFSPPVPRFLLNTSIFNALNYGAACPQTVRNFCMEVLAYLIVHRALIPPKIVFL